MAKVNKKEWKILLELERLKNDIKHDITGPVIASFGFIIALVWRDAIKGALDEYLSRAGLIEKAYLYNFISAVIITVVVISIMISVKKFGAIKKKKKIKELEKKI